VLPLPVPQLVGAGGRQDRGPLSGDPQDLLPALRVLQVPVVRGAGDPFRRNEMDSRVELQRDGLPRLKGLDRKGARELLRSFRALQRRNSRKLGEPFLYFADEIYLMAGVSLPPLKHYSALYQIENGVGLTRYFLEQFRAAARRFPKRLDRPAKITLLTGELAAPFLKKTVIRRLNRIKNMKAELVTADNDFYGGRVTVAGLLAGGDIEAALKQSGSEGLVLMPPSCLNADGRFLDDQTPQDIEKRMNVKLWFLDDWDTLMEYLQ